MSKHEESIILFKALDSIFINSKEETDFTAPQQVNSKPVIDDVICHYLEGEALKEALFIIENIYSFNMKIKWSSVNVWSVWYKRKHTCDIAIKNDSLIIGNVSDIFATRVKYMTYDFENMKRSIYALTNAIVEPQEASYAYQ